MALLAAAAVLRLVWAEDGWFGVDQARDLGWADAIVSGRDFPLAGPLMRGRLHLGAGYYYFWALPRLVTARPVGAYRFAALLGVLAVAGTYRLARAAGGTRAAIGAAALVATAPVAVIDSRVPWAPAVLPALTALFLLVMQRFLARPTRRCAAALAAVATAGTQLHLAAAPLVGVAAVALAVKRRSIGLTGWAVAALAGAIPLLPMAFALSVGSGPAGQVRGDLPPATSTAPGGGALEDAVVASLPAPGSSIMDSWAHRATDLAMLPARLIEGLSSPAARRPGFVGPALLIEAALLPLAALLALVALVSAALRARRRAQSWTEAQVGVARSASLVSASGVLLACLAAVALLPAEAWYYYLDPTLVPGAVVLGATLGRGRRWGGVGLGLLLAVAVLQGGVVLWWLGQVHPSGLISANMDYLRLGGPRAAAPEARARILTLGVKQQAAAVLSERFGITGDRLWRDVHGVGFADLDTDNGFLLGRASRARDRAARGGDLPATADGALVVYRGDFPTLWTAQLPAPVAAGPLDLYRYRRALADAAAVIENCGGIAPPPRPVPDPRRYGFGEPSRPSWPCREPVVRIPVEHLEPPDEVTVRVLARLDGAGRVVSVTSEPPGEPLASAAPGAGIGVELPRAARAVRVALALDGPATLDVYELQGAATR